jgi:hypothetical protein
MHYFQDPRRFVAANPLAPSFVTAEITAFTGVNAIDTTSTIVFEYPLTNTAKVSLGQPVMPDLTDTSYLLAVRFQNAADETVRYVLYNHPDSGFAILYPTYEGQTIFPSAVIEVWANPAETTILASEDIAIKINTLTFYGDTGNSNSNCFCTPLENGAITLVQTTMDPQATGPCNPFCDCLELAAG